MNIKEWEIWWADVMFEDSSEHKRRPVLVLNDCEGLLIETVKITSHPKRDVFDVEINEWKSCGLSKSSTVRLDKVVVLNRNKFISKIGDLSARDKIQIRLVLGRGQRPKQNG